MLLKPEWNAILVIERSVSSIRLLAKWMRRVRATRTGDAPRCWTNNRRRCRAPRPTCPANLSTSPESSPPLKMSFSARETTDEVPHQAGVPGEVCGRHRLQGRKPAASAEAADGNHRTFSGFRSGTGQIGRQ